MSGSYMCTYITFHGVIHKISTLYGIYLCLKKKKKKESSSEGMNPILDKQCVNRQKGNESFMYDLIWY